MPARDRLLAVRDEEGAEVRDHARRDQHVAEQVVELGPELSRDLAPAHPLAAQAAHELLGALKLVIAVLVLALERRLLGVELGELVLHVLELVKHNLELRLLGREALHCLGVLALRDRELRLLWGDHLRDAVVDLHREDPTAKPLGSRRALGRRLGREHLHGLVLLADDFHDLRIDVVLVVRLERVDEHLDVAHHLLGRAEEVVDLLGLVVRILDLLRLDAHHDAHALEDQLDGRGRVAHALDQINVGLLDRVERPDGGLERGHRLGEVSLAFVLHLLRARGHLGHSGLLLGDELLFGLDDLLDLLVDDHRHLARLVDGDEQLRLQISELLLHLGHRIARHAQLLEAVVVPVTNELDLLPLLSEERLEDLDQLEVRRGRHVHQPALRRLELGREHAHRLVEALAHLDHGLPVVLLHLHLGQEGGRDRVERVRGPRPEPIDRAAVDQRWEHAQARAEGVADGRHGEAHVEHRAATVDKVREERGGCAITVEPLVASCLAHLVGNLRLLAVLEEVGHLARIEQAVDVLEVRLLLDLGVGEQEDGRLALHARALEHLLDVLAPVDERIGLGDLDREDLHIGQVRREARDGLTSRAAHAREQRIASGHLKHARDLAHVLDREEEEHELHRLGRDLVVVVQVLDHVLLELRKVAHAPVRLFGRLGVRVARVEQVAHVVVVDLAVGVRVKLLEEFIHLDVEVVHREHLHLLDEPEPVVVVGETVVEDAEELMRPKEHQVGRLLEVFLAREEHALHDARKVAQVEGVVRLGGRG